MDTDLRLRDDARKIFLNTKGTIGEIDSSIKAFLQYVDGVLTADRFVQEIDEEIQKVKMIEGEAVGYMTYEMKISQNIFKSLRHFDDITFKTAYLRPFMQLFRNKTIDNSQGGSLYGDGGQE